MDIPIHLMDFSRLPDPAPSASGRLDPTRVPNTVSRYSDNFGALA